MKGFSKPNLLISAKKSLYYKKSMTLNVIPEENKKYGHFQTIDSILSHHTLNDFDRKNSIHDEIKDLLESCSDSSQQLNSVTSVDYSDNHIDSPHKRNDIDVFKKNKTKENNAQIPNTKFTGANNKKDVGEKKKDSKDQKVRFKNSQEENDIKNQNQDKNHEFNLDEKTTNHIDLDKSPIKS